MSTGFKAAVAVADRQPVDVKQHSADCRELLAVARSVIAELSTADAERLLRLVHVVKCDADRLAY